MMNSCSRMQMVTYPYRTVLQYCTKPYLEIQPYCTAAILNCVIPKSEPTLPLLEKLDLESLVDLVVFAMYN